MHPHDPFHHGCAESPEMEPGQRQARSAPSVEEAEHSTQPVLGRAGSPLSANGIQPPKRENIVTCIPIAAAPVAIMKAAMTRSISPLSTTIVTRSGFVSRNSASATAGSIWVVFMDAPQDHLGMSLALLPTIDARQHQTTRVNSL